MDTATCQKRFISPLAETENRIVTNSNQFTNKMNTFNDFLTNFSNYSNQVLPTPNITQCSAIPQNGALWTPLGIEWLNDQQIPSTVNENVLCNKMFNDLTSLSNTIQSDLQLEKSYLDGINDNSCLGEKQLEELKQKYFVMVQKRKQMDEVVNNYISKDMNTPINQNLQLTDQSLNTGMIWVILATSALYFSFRVMNQ